MATNKTELGKTIILSQQLSTRGERVGVKERKKREKREAREYREAREEREKREPKC